MLYSEHLAICKMKSVARSIVRWPGVDKQLETVARQCIVCAASQKVPPLVRVLFIHGYTHRVHGNELMLI